MDNSSSDHRAVSAGQSNHILSCWQFTAAQRNKSTKRHSNAATRRSHHERT
nr:MAG TPA: hypothetical protein [Caudoviricetes sp.]